MADAAYLIPLFPLLGFLSLVAFGRRLGEPRAGWLATSAVGLSFLASVATFFDLLGHKGEEREVTKHVFTWLKVGGFESEIALLVDPLSVTMALFVTGVGMLIHLYSIGYMEGDPGFSRFFAYLNLFAFSMLVLVLSDNFLFTFVGWEGVGACSYLLISFWFEREQAATAGKKAFVVNRVGDFGFMVAMFLLFFAFGSLSYHEVFEGVEDASHATVTAIALLLFLGACGKSAQLPLFVWLPDAMEGPTPVSALIHAATMVTAGVYLMARVSPILASAETALTVVAVVGAVTALVAAVIACAQNDIKRVLAYSTISQLGYMFLAVGSGAYVAAIFHMVTHAFFKALLFLGAGSVMHGMHEETDMKVMGGLRRWMPVTSATFIVGWLAIAGVPPFSGFWSKDDILLAAYDKSVALWAVGLVTAVLTAYYMSRQVFLVFGGQERWHQAAGASEEHEEPHESPRVMTAPMVGLAGLALVGGVLNLPFDKAKFLEHWLEKPVFEETLHHLSKSAESARLGLAALAVVAGAVGIAIAYVTFVRARRLDAFEPALLKRGSGGFDDLYSLLVERPGRALFSFTSSVFDNRVVDGVANGIASAIRAGGSQLRKVQTGYVRNYALGVTFGAVLLLGYAMLRMGG
ncbi:MAG: NADH-quinone oxidoreductase subunit L [Actinomycetota bacterium]|nr:NADH-quinone oxidoreductase subunit L [Actinomycetota bacterium]